MANNRIIVSPGGSAGAIQSTYDIFGTNAGAETVTVYDSTTANFQGDFARGGDIIKLSDVASDFTVRLAGSNAELVSLSDGIIASVPIGTAGVTIQFETAPNVFGDVRSLVFNGTSVVLGGQVITGTATSLTPYAPPPPVGSGGLVGFSVTLTSGDATSLDQVNNLQPSSHTDSIGEASYGMAIWNTSPTAHAMLNFAEYAAFA